MQSPAQVAPAEDAPGRRFRLHPSFTARIADEGRCRFVGPFSDTVVDGGGGPLTTLLPTLHDPDAMAQALGRLAPAERTIATEAMLALASRDILVDDVLDAELDAFAHVIDFCRRQADRLRADHPWYAALPRERRVAVLEGPPELVEALVQHGLEPVIPGSEAVAGTAFGVALFRAGAAQALEVNRSVLDAGITTLFVEAAAHRIRLGPIVVPRESGCLACAEERWRSNAEYPDIGPRGLNSPSTPRAGIVTSIAVALAVARTAMMVNRLSHLAPAGEVIEFDLVAMALRKGRVIRVPRCPACGVGQVDGGLRPVRAASVE